MMDAQKLKEFENLFKNSLSEITDPDKERQIRIEKYNKSVKKNNFELLMTHRINSQFLRSNPDEVLGAFPDNKNSSCLFRTSNITLKTSKSNCNINSMKKISIKDLKLEETHFGKYIILKIIELPFKRNAILFALGDEFDNVIFFSLYNFEKKQILSSYEDLDKIFSIDKYILIYEPYYKIFQSLSTGIRVDDPDEIIIFDNLNDIKSFIELNKNSTDEEFKNIGNKQMSEGNYKNAIISYNQAIEKNSKNPILYANIAEAYLRLNYNSKALDATNYALNTLNFSNEKILYRKAKALYNLNNFEESLEILEKMKIFVETQKNINEELLKKYKELKDMNLQKIENKKYGKYNMKEMLVNELSSFHLDYADYISEKIQINYSDDKGVFITAKEQIKIGELISATKALVCNSIMNKEMIGENHLFKKSINSENIFLLESNFEEKRKQILDLITNREEKCEEFFCLFDGKNKNMDYNKRKNILKEKKLSHENLLSNIDNVIKHNSFTTTRGICKEIKIASGVWVFPSFLNHSCNSNCYYFGIGDFLFIKCIRNIEKNEEINISYLTSEVNYEKRKAILSKTWNFICKCPLCVLQEKTKDNKIKLYANDFLYCLFIFFKNKKILKPEKKIKKEILQIDYQNIFGEFKKNNPSEKFHEEYKKRIDENAQKEILYKFQKSPKDFFDFLIENKKEFSKFEMYMCLYLYSIYICQNDYFYKDIYILVLEKAFYYCETNDFLYEIKILVNLIHFFKINNEETKYSKYKKILDEKYMAHFDNDNEMKTIFIN